MKKKILHIAEAFGGGVFTYLTSHANATCEEFDVTIAYTLRPQTPDEFEKNLDSRVHLIEMHEVKREINLVQDLKGGFEIYKIYCQVEPDFVHLHSSKAGFLGRMVIDCRRNHVIYTPHGYSFLKKDDSAMVRKIYKMIERVAAIKGGEIVGVSKGEYDESLALTKHATYVNNGIDLKSINTIGIDNVTEINTKELRIGTMGRICYQKNPETFNEIARSLPDDLFMWIGDGEMRAVLDQDNIVISGWMEQSEAIQQLGNINVFVLPSLWEGLSIALLEAMYLKKICIVSDVIGNRDVIVHGENGFIANTADDYVRIIQEIKAGKWDIEKIVARAYQDVCEKYNIDVMCQKYIKIYRKAKKVKRRWKRKSA